MTGALDLSRRLADYAMVLDLLGTLPGTMDEAAVVGAIRNLFTMLCAPAQIVYVPFADGNPGPPLCAPEGWSMGPAWDALLAATRPLPAWTETEQGFLLRVSQGSETLGVLAVEGLAFPQYRTHYLDLALTVLGVCGLAIHNARTYQQLRATIADRERAERKVAQLNRELERHVLRVESANRDLEAFSYTVSHDLRAPLRGIDAWARILGEEHGTALDDDGRQCLGRIRSEAARMNELIDAMLQLARLGRAELREEAVDLGALCREVEHELRAAEPDRQVELDVAPGLTVRGDPALLRSVVRNLLGNAWKFTRDRTPARIAVGERADQGRRVFFVRDNGAGFDPEAAGRLFTPFRRLHRQSEFRGTGIGLASVQRIVQRHGGTVWAEGAVEQGATISFTLGDEPSGVG